MTTLHARTIVSLTATMAVTLALGACASAPSRPALDGPASMGGLAPHEVSGLPLTIRFDNEGREHVHVYLVDGRQQQWRLGRVEPWSYANLRIPAAALVGNPGFMRVAVLTGERMTPQVVRNPRATFTVAQPASAIVSQRYMFAQGQLTPLPLGAARVNVGRQ